MSAVHAVVAEVAHKTRRREPEERQTGSHVHAGSLFLEHTTPNRRLRRAEARALRMASEEMFGRLRRPGKVPGGPDGLTLFELRVWRAHIRFAERYDQILQTAANIAEAAKCSIRTVWRAIKKLESLGLLEHDRTCIRTGRRGKRGELVEQGPNNYRLLIPPSLQKIMDVVRRRIGPAPTDSDTDAHNAEREAMEKWERRNSWRDKLPADLRAKLDRIDEAETGVTAWR